MLAPGTRLGPYEIVSLLGAGGMGEVYRAHDPRLGRHVAIKILPAAFSTDGERLWRFEREARAVASLNHPNICTIHDIGEHDGHRYLVMELLEGEPLDVRLKAGPIAVTALSDLSVQIADALDAAHGAGVIHRDLKPANIFVTRRGEAKLLDFGLAKLSDADGDPQVTRLASRPDVSNSPTMLAPRDGTTLGAMLGTAAYMSPEQARGEIADAQSDLFSLGAVFYEMATGRPAFSGPTMAVLFDGILNRQPPPMRSVNPALPADFEHIVAKALEKDRDLRYRSAADMRADLKRMRRDSAAGIGSTSVAAAPPVPASVPVPSSGTRQSRDRGDETRGGNPGRVGWFQRRQKTIGERLVRLAAFALVLVAIYMFRDGNRTERGPASLPSIDSMQVTQLTSTGNASRPAISPDGKYVVYLQEEADCGMSVWLRQAAATNSVKILSCEPNQSARAATVGPDSTFVDVLRGSQLLRVPFLGGAPRLIVDRLSLPIGWSPDGRSMAFIRGANGGLASELIVADAEGQQERVLASRGFPASFVTNVPGATMVGPAWSPDGRRVAALQRLGDDVRDMGVSVFDVSGGDARVVSVRGDVPQGLGWLDEDTLVVGQALEQGTPSQLWRVSFPGGRRTRLTNDVNRYSDLSLSADANTLVTSRPETRVSVWVGDAKGAGKDVVAPSPFLSSATQYATVAWEGQELLFTHTLNGRFEIFRQAFDPGATPEALAAGRDLSAADNGTIVFRSVSGDDVGIWKVDRDGRHPRQLVPGSMTFSLVTADGKQVVFSSPGGGEQSVYRVSTDGGAVTRIVNDPVPLSGFSDVSPDGRTIAIVLAGRWTLCAFPVCDNRRPLGLAGVRVRWTPDGRSLTYLEPTERNLWLFPLDGAAPRQLTHFDDGQPIGDFAWSRDGQRLAVSRSTASSDIVMFRGLRGH